MSIYTLCELLMISNINKGKIVIKKLIAFKILKGFRLNVT